MDKILYFCDAHFGAAPLCRKDNYNQSILNKIEFVLKLARKNNCVVLNGGDLFDRPTIKYIDLIALANLLSNYKDVKFFSIMGNESHDGLPEVSPLRLFKMAGLIKNIDDFVDFNETRIIFKDHGGDNTENVSSEHYNILMTHEMILEKPAIFEHILISEVQTKSQMVTLAHFHPYQGIITRDDGVVFVSPGALSRRKKIAHEIDRNPKIVYICINDKRLISIKEIDVPCEKDIWVPKEVIDIFDDAYVAILEEEIKKMKETIDVQMNTISLEDFIKLFAKNISLKDEILNIALERIRKV